MIVSVSNRVQSAFFTIRDAVNEDDEYAWSWHCSIAVSVMDAGGNHKDANKAAARFMLQAFGKKAEEMEYYMYK